MARRAGIPAYDIGARDEGHTDVGIAEGGLMNDGAVRCGVEEDASEVPVVGLSEETGEGRITNHQFPVGIERECVRNVADSEGGIVAVERTAPFQYKLPHCSCGRVEVKGHITEGDKKFDLLMQRVPGDEDLQIWKVSNATVARVADLYKEYGYGPLVEAFAKAIPDGRILGIEY